MNSGDKWRKYKAEQDRLANKANLCKISVPKLQELLKKIESGECGSDCQGDVQLYLDHMNKGNLCSKAKKLLEKILMKFGGRTEKRRNSWYGVKLKF